MEWWMWIIIAVVIIIIILFILAWLGANSDSEDDEGGFLGLTMQNIKNGCGKLLNRARGC